VHGASMARVDVPPQVTDPNQIISYEDWLLLSGQLMRGEVADKAAGAKGGALHEVGRTADGRPVGQSTPRTRARGLDTMLRRLGLDTALAPDELRSLRAELLGMAQIKSEAARGAAQSAAAAGQLSVLIHEARGLPDLERHGSMHPYCHPRYGTLTEMP
jgi:hypothetical protein